MYLGTVIHFANIASVVQYTDNPAHGFFGVILHMLHIGPHGRQTIVHHHFFERRNTGGIGGDLGLEIGNILIRIARRIFSPGEQLAHGLFTKLTPRHETNVLD